jgi:hypothetical protein
MEPMHWQYVGALGGVVTIGWLVVVPMYRGWKHLNDKMTARVKRSIRMVAECDGLPMAATTTACATLRPTELGPPLAKARRRP